MVRTNSSDTITSQLISEIREALESVKFGSIEIFIQNKVITQITVRNIKKTSVEIQKESKDPNPKDSRKIILERTVV